MENFEDPNYAANMQQAGIGIGRNLLTIRTSHNESSLVGLEVMKANASVYLG